jgi:hypothetical protein
MCYAGQGVSKHKYCIVYRSILNKKMWSAMKKITELSSRKWKIIKVMLIAYAVSSAGSSVAQCSTAEIPSSQCSGTDNITKFKLAGVALSSHCNAEGAKMIGDLGIGESYSFSATSGTLKQWLAIWVDLDNDNEYAIDEMLFVSEKPKRAHMGTITIPADVLPAQNVRMRLRCKWGGVPITADQACRPFTWGETEDHYLNLMYLQNSKSRDEIGSARLKIELLNISPNPVSSIGSVMLRSNLLTNAGLRIVDATGRVVYGSRHEIVDGVNAVEIDLSALSPGGYTLHVISDGVHIAPKQFVKI